MILCYVSAFQHWNHKSRTSWRAKSARNVSKAKQLFTNCSLCSNLEFRNWIQVRKATKIKIDTIKYHSWPFTTWESNKNTIHITNKSQEVSPFPAGDLKAAINRRSSMRTQDATNTNDSQKNYCFGTTTMNRRKSMRNTRHNKHKWSTKEVPPWNDNNDQTRNYEKHKTQQTQMIHKRNTALERQQWTDSK